MDRFSHERKFCQRFYTHLNFYNFQEKAILTSLSAYKLTIDKVEASRFKMKSSESLYDLLLGNYIDNFSLTLVQLCSSL